MTLPRAKEPPSTVDKLYWTDPYLTTCTARVTSVHGAVVTLDRTVAFARSGGQASDEGTIGGRRIVEARTRGLVIDYVLPDDHGLREGEIVDVMIDGETRLRLMRLHFAAELVLELVTRLLPSAEKIGADITRTKARLDFAFDGNIGSELDAIARELETLVSADHRIISDFSDLEHERRFWEIEGFAHVPCGGTHLRSTGEVGTVALRRSNPGRGKERIEIVLAD